MNAKDRNREIFNETGLVLTGLPAQYRNDHPICIHFELIGLHPVFSGDEGDYRVFDIHLVRPEVDAGGMDKWDQSSPARAFMEVHMTGHPGNDKLEQLLERLVGTVPTMIAFGRQYEGRFYIRAMHIADDEDMSREAFSYFLDRMGIHYDSPVPVPVGTNDDVEEYASLIYDLFREQYPKGIRRYLDENCSKSRYEESVRRFVLMDWSDPVLNLPTVAEARRILDETVYGMEEVKERLLEFLEIVRRSGNLARNLLLVGPPGTGKTTLMQAVARMLGLPMSVVPMSACADNEALVGFARTYTGAQEGLLTTALLAPVLEKPDGSREIVHQISQVLFLNELDKVTAAGNHHGSVQASLLRMLDDNRTFFDVFHQCHIDLKNVVVVADANDLSKISDALQDRFEIIEIPPYTEEEKARIFRLFTFPQALKAQKVAPGEVAVTREAVGRIVSSSDEAGAREMRRVADRILGNYLLHHAGGPDTVQYTPEMVTPFLPRRDIRSAVFPSQPGSVRSAVVVDGRARNVQVQCTVTPTIFPGLKLFGSTNIALRQELEAAVFCACRFLPEEDYEVKVQLFGVPADADLAGELSFPTFVAVLSAAYERTMDGIFYGGTTLLGGMSSVGCDDPDAVMCLADRSGAPRVYTATGFTERMHLPHTTEVCELLDAEVARTFLFGNAGLMAV